jgi:hypothetical protein
MVNNLVSKGKEHANILELECKCVEIGVHGVQGVDFLNLHILSFMLCINNGCFLYSSSIFQKS